MHIKEKMSSRFFTCCMALFGVANIYAWNINSNSNAKIKVDVQTNCIDKMLAHQLTVGSTFYNGDSLILNSTISDFTSNNFCDSCYYNYLELVRTTNAQMRQLSIEHRERAMIDFAYYCQRADSIILHKPLTIFPLANHIVKNLYFCDGQGLITEIERANASMLGYHISSVFTPYGNIDIIRKKDELTQNDSPIYEKLLVVNGIPTYLKYWYVLFYPEIRDFIETLTFMPKEESLRQFGEIGRNGALLFVMKPEFNDNILQEWDFRISLIKLTTYVCYSLSLEMRPMTISNKYNK